jgi:KaiC/GvpD/RAD55 family RecA-like ATPase
MQYLMAGAAAGEPVLYVTLSETEEELRAVAQSHGWTLDGVEIRELTPPEAALDLDEQNTMFHPSEIELASTTKRILEDVERLKPTRVVFDSLSELRLLAGTAFRYRRQILALKQFFSTRDCTVILLDDMTATNHDQQMQSIAHGVVLNAMPEERYLTIQLHELLMYLGQRSVATILIGAHQGLIGSQMNTPVDASYLADAVILMRYFEHRGEVRQAISVIKKRGSQHERSIREFRFDSGGLQVGKALRDFRGILTGVPVYEGSTETLMGNR